MANSAQARKRARQSEKHRRQNAAQRTELRTYIKKVTAAIGSGDATVARETYQMAVPVIDKMAGKGLIHKNKAARHKKRLNAHIRAM